MKVHELHNIWYDGNRSDPMFMIICKNMLDYMRIETTEDSILYEVMRDDVKYNTEDCLRLLTEEEE
jgi:hypothetical protein|nr:MAG TPA: hypothetical protein [Caudoviricetes sp.]